MKKITGYLNFLKEKGNSLSTINPGSQEVALTADDALKALELIKDSKLIILGGDILSEKDNELIYAYQLWGQEYHVLNWYLTKEDYEKKDYSKSYALANDAIIKASAIAKKLKSQCYIVLVTE